MSCSRRGSTWRRGVMRILGKPETGLLVLVGLALLVAGVALDETTLVGMGGGAVIVSVLLSIATTIKLAGGVEVTLLSADLEASFDRFVVESRTSLGRLATTLCGEEGSAELVSEVLARAYVEWDGDLRALHSHVVCLTVRRALGRQRLGELPVAEADLYRRVLLLLDHDDLDVDTIAEIFDRLPAQVEKDLRAYRGSHQPTAPTWIEAIPAPTVDLVDVSERAHRRLRRWVVATSVLALLAAGALFAVGQQARNVVHAEPVAPTLTAKATGPNAASLSWAVPTEKPVRYRLYRDNALIGEVLHPALSYNDDRLQASSTYAYEVLVVDEEGVSSPRSGPVEVKTPAPSPATNVRASESKGVVTVSWTLSPSPRVVGYRVYRDTTPIGDVGKVGHFEDRKAPAGGTYVYAVRAIDADGKRSAVARAAPFTVPARDATAPTSPSDVTARSSRLSSGTTVITVAWKAATDNVGVHQYQVFRDGVRLATVEGTALRYVDPAPDQRKIYSHDYTVVAVDAAGNESPPSEPATVPFPTPPFTTTTSSSTTTTSRPRP